MVLGDAFYDSRLFVELAQNLSQGRWLGPYHERTLIKGPFYPLWIAATHSIHVPLLTAQHCLYLAACAAAAWALFRFFDPWCALFFWTLLWFNPMSYALYTSMVMREYVSASLAMLVVAFSFLLFRDVGPSWRRTLYAGILGIVFSAFWLTREESLWILPFYGVTVLHVFLRLRFGSKNSWRNLVINGALALFPLGILAGSIVVVMELNRAHYGIAETVEIKSRFFRDAYGALTRVHSDIFKPAVPVPREVREKVYGVSPSFAELRPFLEREDTGWACTLRHLKRLYETGGLDDTARKGIDFILRHDASGVWRGIWEKVDEEPCDLHGPWFVWAFREAAAAAGYHRSAPEARAYYERLAREIHGACDRKEIPCGPARSSLAPRWRWEFLPPWVKMFGQVLHLAVSHQGFHYETSVSKGDAKAQALFRHMTHEDPMPLEKAAPSSKEIFRTTVLDHIAVFYRVVFPWLFYAALGVHLLLSFSKKTILGPLWGFATAVLASCATLAAILAYVHVTSFPGIEPRYLAPLPPLAILYVALVFPAMKDFLRSPEPPPDILRHKKRKPAEG
ncbi:MAG: hypothetical protein WHS46_00210 [Desulfosoma sp.]